jgi:hypothetical protein
MRYQARPLSVSNTRLNSLSVRQNPRQTLLGGNSPCHWPITFITSVKPTPRRNAPGISFLALKKFGGAAVQEVRFKAVSRITTCDLNKRLSN